MLENNFTIKAAFILYVLITLVIGYIAYKRTSSSSDYFLGGRSLGPLTAALSADASDMSGWLLMGLPGYAYVAGLKAVWLAGGLLLGKYLNWLIVAKRLRTYTIIADNSLTIPEFLGRRFGDRSKLLQTISALFILGFYLFYTSSGLVAGGKLFESAFGFDYTVAVIIAAICVVSYTLFGGFLAVAWTDLMQGLLMLAALLIVPIAIMSDVGSDLASLELKSPHLLSLFRDVGGKPLSAIAIISLVVWGLGYFGQPHILARFKATRSNASITSARRIAVSWATLSLIGAILVGLFGIIYVDHHELTVVDSEQIFMILTNAIFHPVIAGILLAAVLAAIMSTIDSQLLISSAALAEDLYKQLFRSKASSKEILIISRLCTAVLSILALILAINPDSSVLDLVSYAWGGFGAAFGPVLLLSLYWKRMNYNGALSGIILGGLTVIIWKHLSGGIFEVYELLPGFILGGIATIMVSLFTKKPQKQVMTQFSNFKTKLKELK